MTAYPGERVFTKKVPTILLHPRQLSPNPLLLSSTFHHRRRHAVNFRDGVSLCAPRGARQRREGQCPALGLCLQGVSDMKLHSENPRHASSLQPNSRLPVNLATPGDRQKNQGPLAREGIHDTTPDLEHAPEPQRGKRTPTSQNSVGCLPSNSRRRRKPPACPNHHHRPVSTTRESRPRRSRLNAFSTDTDPRTASGK